MKVTKLLNELANHEYLNINPQAVELTATADIRPDLQVIFKLERTATGICCGIYHEGYGHRQQALFTSEFSSNLAEYCEYNQYTLEEERTLITLIGQMLATKHYDLNVKLRYYKHRKKRIETALREKIEFYS